MVGETRVVLTLTNRSAVLSRKARKIVVMLLICMIAGVFIKCQIHAAPGKRHRAASTEHRPTSSGHPTVDFSCVVAALPSLVFFLFLLFTLLQITPVLLHHALLTSPLLRPPRDSAY